VFDLAITSWPGSNGKLTAAITPPSALPAPGKNIDRLLRRDLFVDFSVGHCDPPSTKTFRRR
jgi:hypothetical protein